MPRAPKHCGHPDCTTRVTGATYCSAHAPTPWAGPHHRAGSTRASRASRATVLARDTTCRCRGCTFCIDGCRFTATQDDHITPRSQGGGDELTNRQGLCGPCHQAKTLAEAAAARRNGAPVPEPPAPFRSGHRVALVGSPADPRNERRLR